MRIAWIDYSAFGGYLFRISMRERGIELVGAGSPEDFEERHGKIEDYDGLLAHPGIKNQKYFINFFAEHPDMPFALLSSSSWDYTCERIPIFSYESVDAIASYFKSRSAVGKESEENIKQE